MCCISRSESGGPPFSCCCGCSMFCGFILIAVLEVLTLIASFTSLDIVGILFSAVLVVMFAIGLCMRDSEKIRFYILIVYLLRILVIAVTMLYYIISQKVTTLMVVLCEALNVLPNVEYEDCQSDLSGTFWLIVGIYTALILSIRLALA